VLMTNQLVMWHVSKEQSVSIAILRQELEQTRITHHIYLIRGQYPKSLRQFEFSDIQQRQGGVLNRR
jgi:hypothetical protein